MFESAEIGHAIDKEAYEAAVPALREALLPQETSRADGEALAHKLGMH